MLDNFFRINLPYGLKRNNKDEWMAFNREYMPIGWSSMQGKESIHSETPYAKLPVYASYKGLSDNVLRSLAWDDADGVHYDNDGKINMVFLYNDRSNPTNNDKQESWDTYFEKVITLSRLQQRDPSRAVSQLTR